MGGYYYPDTSHYHRSTGLGRAGHGTGVCRGRTPALTRVSIEDNLFGNVCQAVFIFW